MAAAAAATAGLVLAGCTSLDPQYSQPAPPVPASYPAMPDGAADNGGPAQAVP